VPDDIRPALAEALARMLLAGETTHPSQGRLRRAAQELGELWRRSGGELADAAPEALRARVAGRLARVTGWSSFLQTPVEIDAGTIVPAGERARLEALPGKVKLFGDQVPLRYEVTSAGPAVRLELREGQARRLQPADLPPVDRPLRFAVARGTRPALHADTLEELRAMLRQAEQQERRDRFKPPRHRRRR